MTDSVTPPREYGSKGGMSFFGYLMAAILVILLLPLLPFILLIKLLDLLLRERATAA